MAGITQSKGQIGSPANTTGNPDMVYDDIAESWYNRRHWTRFREELDALAGRWKGGRLLNVGSAHGPDFLPFTGSFELVGMDISAGMLRMGLKYRKKHRIEAELVQADARRLPFSDASFDWAIAVATYHHIGSREERKMAFAELRRVLRPGGEAFITVWNRWQPKFWSRGKETMVPWRAKRGTFNRYYYLFSRGEIAAELKAANLEVVQLQPQTTFRSPLAAFRPNICLLVKKAI